jgi:hypothetical protein
MKKLLFMLLIFISFVHLHAEKKWCIKYGINYSAFTDKDNDFIKGNLFGISRDWSISNKIKIGTEFLISKRGGIIKNVVYLTQSEIDVCQIDAYITFIYLELPLLLKYTLKSAKNSKINCYIGPSYKIGFKGKNNSKNFKHLFEIPYPQYENYQFEYIVHADAYVPASGFDINFGSNIIWYFLSGEIRYSYALHKIDKLADIEPINKKKRTHAIHFIVGLNF